MIESKVSKWKWNPFFFVFDILAIWESGGALEICVRELPSVHSWVVLGFESAADSFIHTLSGKEVTVLATAQQQTGEVSDLSYLLCEWVNDAGDYSLSSIPYLDWRELLFLIFESFFHLFLLPITYVVVCSEAYQETPCHLHPLPFLLQPSSLRVSSKEIALPLWLLGTWAHFPVLHSTYGRPSIPACRWGCSSHLGLCVNDRERERERCGDGYQPWNPALLHL